MELKLWCRREGGGDVAITPGVIFSDADDVIPDVAWVSQERLHSLMDAAGHLTGAPDLAVKVLSLAFATKNVTARPSVSFTKPKVSASIGY